MFEFLRNFADQIGQFFSKIWDILVFIFEELTQFFKLIKPAVNFFQTLLTSLPPVYLIFGIAILAVLIIYIIIGRTAGGD